MNSIDVSAVRPSAATRPPLTRLTKLAYGLGAIGGGAQAQLLGLLLLFYNQLVGLPAQWVSAALSISILLDALWDPIVGQMSDNTRSRWGRRHPYILGAALPAAACFAFLFIPPLGWSDQALFLYLAAMIILARLFSSLCEIPLSALAPELTQDYDERTNVQSYRFLFSAVVGGLAATVLGFGYFLRGSKAEPFGQFNQAGYAPYAITVAAISAIGVITAAIATRRFIPHLHKPPQRRASFGDQANAIRAALTDRNFVALAAASLLFGVANGMHHGLGLYFDTYIFDLGSKALLTLRLWVIPSGLIGVFLAPAISRRFEKRQACIVVFLITIAAGLSPLAAWLLGLMPPHAPWVLPVLIVDRVAVAALGTTGFILTSSMIADVVEAAQLRTGRRSEGLLFASESLLRKATTSFAVLLPGLFLAVVGFPAHARPEHVDVGALRRLVWLYLPVHTAITLCSTFVLLFYRIGRAEHEGNLLRLDGSTMLEDAAEGTPDIGSTAA